MTSIPTTVELKEASAALNPDYARRLNIVGAVLLFIAAWSIYDGAIVWPRFNKQLDQARPTLQAEDRTPEEWLEDDPVSELAILDETFIQLTGQPAPRKLSQKIDQLRLGSADEANDVTLERQHQAMVELLADPLYTRSNLRGQFIQALITGALALLALGSIWRKRKRVFHAGEQGLSGSGFGGDYGWDSIERIDWSRWSNKDIAVVYFKDGRKVTLDGWHFRGMLQVAEVIKAKAL